MNEVGHIIAANIKCIMGNVGSHLARLAFRLAIFHDLAFAYIRSAAIDMKEMFVLKVHFCIYYLKVFLFDGKAGKCCLAFFVFSHVFSLNVFIYMERFSVSFLAEECPLAGPGDRLCNAVWCSGFYFLCNTCIMNVYTCTCMYYLIPLKLFC